MSDYLPFQPPPPASFDFAGVYASQPICFYNPFDPGSPRLLAGWQRLVSAFAGAMSSQTGNPGDWLDGTFANNWLTVRAYPSWRWSRGANRYPVFLEVPYGTPGTGAGRVFITVPTPATPANGLPAVWQDYLSQGFPPYP